MDKALGYLSLSAKAGKLVTGADACIQALAAGKAKLVVLASDASANAVKRGEGMTHGRITPLFTSTYTKQQLSQASGRPGPVAIAAICDEGLARAFINAARSGQSKEEE